MEKSINNVLSVNVSEATEVYGEQKKILVAVDCIVFGFDGKELKLLLFKRKVEPLKGAWSLIGAFIKEDMNLEESAEKILFESTGLDQVYLQELKTFSNVNRDSGGRVISVAFYSLIQLKKSKTDKLPHYEARWFSLNKIPDLILDHQQMVEEAIKELRKKGNQPIGFNLLPEKFTLPQIQVLYESIYQKEFDNRNFRKKLLSLGILIKTDKKDKSSSKKGAYLYEFNKEKIEKMAVEKYDFGL
ncbi:NUDIX domain-containing protein [Tenacibaculum sp. UWU-22]|uniref:NUDIX hydrolase n=1 Tax=Tenacibaculum sp. UWU-22 TaxID=3234187 RepID=UPI0034DAE0C2